MSCGDPRVVFRAVNRRPESSVSPGQQGGEADGTSPRDNASGARHEGEVREEGTAWEISLSSGGGLLTKPSSKN